MQIIIASRLMFLFLLGLFQLPLRVCFVINSEVIKETKEQLTLYRPIPGPIDISIVRKSYMYCVLFQR